MLPQEGLLYLQPKAQATAADDAGLVPSAAAAAVGDEPAAAATAPAGTSGPGGAAGPGEGAEASAGDGSLFIGDVRLSDVKQALAAVGIPSEFQARFGHWSCRSMWLSC
jgi:hypothetical protein